MVYKTEITEKQIEITFNEISKHTEKNPIKSKELEKILGIKDVDGHPATRRIIEETMRQREIPIGANNNGFFVIKSKQELNDYVQALNNRVAGIFGRVAVVNEIYYKTTGEERDYHDYGVDDEDADIL